MCRQIKCIAHDTVRLMQLLRGAKCISANRSCLAGSAVLLGQFWDWLCSTGAGSAILLGQCIQQGLQLLHAYICCCSCRNDFLHMLLIEGQGWP
jgi:hypothetical protein